MNGIALMVLAGQLGKLFGYSSGSREFTGQICAHFDRATSPTAILGLATALGLLLIRRYAPRLRGPLIAVTAGVVVAALFDLRALGVNLTGALPAGLPQTRLPAASLPMS
jgi:MFS superfamily sulfate permease-like transporter